MGAGVGVGVRVGVGVGIRVEGWGWGWGRGCFYQQYIGNMSLAIRTEVRVGLGGWGRLWVVVRGHTPSKFSIPVDVERVTFGPLSHSPNPSPTS